MVTNLERIKQAIQETPWIAGSEAELTRRITQNPTFYANPGQVEREINIFRQSDISKATDEQKKQWAINKDIFGNLYRGVSTETNPIAQSLLTGQKLAEAQYPATPPVASQATGASAQATPQASAGYEQQLALWKAREPSNTVGPEWQNWRASMPITATAQQSSMGTTQFPQATTTGDQANQAAQAAQQAQQDAILKQIQQQLDVGQKLAVSAITGAGVPIASTTPSLATEYQTAQTTQLEPLETQMATLDKQINDLNALYQTASVEESKRLGPMAIINRRKSKISEEQQIELSRLNIEKGILQNQISNKQASINTIMSLKQQDYQNAQANYQYEMNKQIQMQQILSNQQDKQIADAQANLNVVLGQLNDSNTDWASLPQAMQTSLNNLVMQAGISTDFLPALIQATQGTDKLLTTVKNDQTGDVSMIFQDAQGNLITKVAKGVGEITPVLTGGGGTGGGTVSTGTVGNLLGMDTKIATKFDTDFEQQYQYVINGKYGREGARERAGNVLAAKYPGFKDVIWELMYGSSRFNAVFPDGYESLIQGGTTNETISTINSDTPVNPFK